jgi:hypothetical protein
VVGREWGGVRGGEAGGEREGGREREKERERAERRVDIVGRSEEKKTREKEAVCAMAR